MEQYIEKRFEKIEDEIENIKQTQQEINVKDIKQNSMLTAIHTRLDTMDEDQKDLNHYLKDHMKEEEVHHINVTAHMSKTNEILEHLSPKTDVEVQKGRIDTLWILGSLATGVVTLSLTTLIWYIKVDISTHKLQPQQVVKNIIKD